MQNRFLTQIVHEPTRDQAILDLVLVSDPTIISTLQIGEPLSNSDHNSIRLGLNIQIGHQGQCKTFLDFRNANFEGLNKELATVNWDTVLDTDSIDQQWQPLKV